MSNGNVTGGAVGNFVLSPDGKTLYLASEGSLRIYDTQSMTLVRSVSLGTKLGAIDISPDGSFLLITEQQPVLHTPRDPWWENVTVSAVYRYDTSTGVSSVMTYQATGSEYTFADVAITSSGTAILSMNILPGWSGWVPMVSLDLASRTFSEVSGNSYYQGGSLTPAPDHSNVLYGQLNLSSADAYVLSPTGTTVFTTSTYANGVYGYAGGIEAYSGAGGRIAISTGGAVHLWNSSLGYIANLTTSFSQLNSVAGLTFSADGSTLFALSSARDQIFGIRMSDRSLTEIITLADYSYPISAWGNELALSPDGKTFYISTTEGIVAANRFNDTKAIKDFNGDGRSDLFFQSSTSGAVTLWQAQANGKFQEAPNSAPNALDPSWKVAGFGDFNGDGKSDILWRHSSGTIGEWLGQSGQFTNNSGVAANSVDSSWKVVGTADYNGDGRADVLWRHSSGEIGQWTARADGSFANNGGAAANFVDNSWTVVASGDFNGDGKADVLWKHSSGAYAEWQGSSSGKLVNVGAVLTNANGTVVGAGDFNGDGRMDVLVRNAQSGLITEFLGQSNGQFSGNVPTLQVTDPNWKVVAIGDYNGDGRADLVWQHSSGAMTEWLATATGDFVNNGPLANTPLGQSIVSPDIWYV